MSNESLYNQLLSHLSKTTSGVLTAADLGSTAALGSDTAIPAETLIKPTADTDANSSSFGAKVTATSIKFGSPSQSVQSVSNNSTNWGQLASSFVSGGLTSLLGGGGGSFGLGSLVSGLLGLFGGGSKSLPALPLFTLPVSQDVTVYTGSSGSTVYQGGMDQTVVPKSPGPNYSDISSGRAARTPASTTSASDHASTLPTPASVAPTDVNSQWFMDRSNDIAAAVRNAMLNSSSLNDVVAEV